MEEALSFELLVEEELSFELLVEEALSSELLVEEALSSELFDFVVDFVSDSVLLFSIFFFAVSELISITTFVSSRKNR